mmetsp:Transcript_46529/g.107399  ORF Transcript_46529/g.107399 Transcript_46529/m.107399 type:complete len:257 (+) Transcript_46529:126-896(+)
MQDTGRGLSVMRRTLQLAVGELSPKRPLATTRGVLTLKSTAVPLSAHGLPLTPAWQPLPRSTLQLAGSSRLLTDPHLHPGKDDSPTDYELSLGKITETLRGDYPAFFERKPNFSIYDERVEFELGRPFHSVSALRGKRAYSSALVALQRLGSSAVRDGAVLCQIGDGTPYGHALRVAWECRGTMICSICPVYVSGISLYSVTRALGGDPTLSHRIHRHIIEFVEIQPPSLRSLLVQLWWQRQQSRMGPVLAVRGTA